ncbi:MAG: hypothetical protein GF331_12085 [Chitinivibrionales bacterium]|nr:hypothetical protein [Chitinivibrionales bacterium]
MRTSVFGAAIALLSVVIFAQTTLTVNATSVVADLSNRPIGINTDYLMDDDMRMSPSRSTADALTEMRIGYLRYPGGEKSDNYLWSVSPWNGPDITAARTNAWPAGDTRFFTDGRDGVAALLDFDEFIALCRSAGAEPIICVAFDSMYKPASGGETPPTKTQLKQNAVEWVRYANVTKGYDVKYWTLGNETDYNESYAGRNPGAATYGADAAEFAQAMKAVDPSILVGVNGHSATWFGNVLAQCQSSVDYLEVHTYPTWNYAGYDQYRTSLPGFTSEVDMATGVINGLASQADRDRLFVTLTETNAIYWGETPGWDNVNDLGHALAVFDIIGCHLSRAKLRMSLLWNTRWVDNDAAALPVGTTNLFASEDNPGFEDGASGWTMPTGASITTAAADVHSGSRALRCEGGSDVYVLRSVPASRLQAGAVYALSVWGKVSATANWSGAGLDFKKGGAKVSSVGFTIDSWSYARYTQAFVAPDDFDEIQPWVYKMGSSDVLFVDDFAVTEGAPPLVNDALTRTGAFNATGRALAIWGQFMASKLVSVSGLTTAIRAFATASATGDTLNVFILNKALSQQQVYLTINGYTGGTVARRWVFSGDGPGDMAPSWTESSTASLSDGSVSLSVPAVSVSVLSFAPMVGRAEGIPATRPCAGPADVKSFDLRGRSVEYSAHEASGSPAPGVHILHDAQRSDKAVRY